MGHFLMQMGTLPDLCVSRKGLDTAEEFSKMFKTSKCSDISWSIFGVPVSLLNGTLHALILGTSVQLSRRKKLMGAC